jgi:predicted phosphoribosyltransferase
MVRPGRLAINPVSDLKIGSRQMLFCDRIDAGRKLAAALTAYKSEDCVVFALLRGGVPVAAEVAAFLPAPLDLILVRKIGAPNQPELAIGAIVDGKAPIIVKNLRVIKMLGMQVAEFQALCQRELAEIERRRKRYMEDKAPISAKGRIAIVIDDGIATGAIALMQHDLAGALLVWRSVQKSDF